MLHRRICLHRVNVVRVANINIHGTQKRDADHSMSNLIV